MKFRLRTSLAVFSVSAAMAMGSAFVVSYGAPKLIGGIPIIKSPYWPVLILALGIGGVLMILTKGRALPPFVDRRLSGSLALVPLAAALGFATYFRDLPSLAFLICALPSAAYLLWTVEPEPETITHNLIDLQGVGTLFLLGVFSAAFPRAGGFIPPAMGAACAIVAAVAGYFLLRAPFSSRAAIARLALGVAITTVAGYAFVALEPLYAVVFLPLGLLLVLFPFLRSVRMGAPSPPGLTEENIVVNQFEKIAELTVWSIYIFTLVHAYFNPPGLSNALFGLFIAGFVIFSIEYEMISERKSTYEFIQRKSLVNAVLLGFISHLTGGFQSPYAWFFIMVLVSGSFVPNPKMIMHRLYVIAGYYAFETAYSARYGLLNETVIVDHLVVQGFVIGLSGVYAYRLALRRKQIDEDLMAKNVSLALALEGERSAKAKVEAQAGEIAQAKKRNDAMLDSLADAVVGIDAHGGIVFMNAAAEGLLEASTADVKGKRFRVLFPLKRENQPDFRVGDYIDSALHGGAVPLPEDVFLERAGGKAFVSGVAVPIFDEKKRPDGAILVLQDVSYVREVEQMKTGFLSVAAHQLRTPLSTIRWYLELLNDPTEGRLKKNQKMFAENAYLSLRKMVGLVNRLLAVTRLESGRVPFRPEPTDLKAMTEEILESLKTKLSERRLEITADLPDLPAVPLDPTLAREVFINLIENAIRYTPDGGKISIAAREDSDSVVWSVADTGIGIPKAQQEKIFEKFFRAGNAVEYTTEGSGLGLYLAKFIVDAWGGRIGFSSEEGKGSTFHVSIPKKGMKAKSGQVSLNA